MQREWRKNGVRIRVWSTIPEGKPRGDMCLPVMYLTVGILSMIFGVVACILMVAADGPAVLFLVGLLCIPAGIMSILEWRNRTIRMCPKDMFEYSNTFGKKQMYSFSDIKEIRQGLISTKLILADRSIPISSDAIISERFRKRLDALNGRDDH